MNQFNATIMIVIGNVSHLTQETCSWGNDQIGTIKCEVIMTIKQVIIARLY